AVVGPPPDDGAVAHVPVVLVDELVARRGLHRRAHGRVDVVVVEELLDDLPGGEAEPAGSRSRADCHVHPFVCGTGAVLVCTKPTVAARGPASAQIHASAGPRRVPPVGWSLSHPPRWATFDREAVMARQWKGQVSHTFAVTADARREKRERVSSRDESSPLIAGLLSQVKDIDAEETQEWLESLDGLIDERGGPRARYILLNLLQRARERSVAIPNPITTPYVNTIPVHQEPYFPGDEAVERTYRGWIRWNAAVMVTRAQRPGVAVGGHISSYASLATLYEVGMNHFFRGKQHPGGGDHIFFQGHASPGNYARAYLEGRLTEEDLDGFRQEYSHPATSEGRGLPSYPHPRRMPDFWEYPTVSMGLGPAQAIYQALANKYLHERGIKDTSQQHVWAFLGGGEVDEPEARGVRP